MSDLADSEPDLTGQVLEAVAALDEMEAERLRGRPTHLTPQIQKKVSDSLIRGTHRHIAFRAAGISWRIGYQWVARGTPGTPEYAKLGPRGQGDPDVYPDDWPKEDLRGKPYPGRYALFANAVEESEAIAENFYVGVVAAAAARGEWRAAEVWLKRKVPERWREEVTLEGALLAKAGETVMIEENDVTLMADLLRIVGRTKGIAAAAEDQIIDAEVVEEPKDAQMISTVHPPGTYPQQKRREPFRT
jgi:hypothetical protein